MKQLVLGILAHVDAGKTTLSEALLYRTGAIRDLGRVDHKNAHLDTHVLERARGITIFSRQARLTLGDTAVTLLDTPGHVDFSAEMERTLQVLDYAVLVISGTDGVQAHTETLWQLLRRYRVPVFVFVTKMDLPGADRAALMSDLRAHLSGACVDFTAPDPEQIALCDEAVLEQYLDTGALPDETVRALIRSRKLFPCLFGSGLKLTGGQLRVRAPLTYFPRGADTPVQEKVNAIRLYSGEKFESAETVPAGGVCAVQGLTQTYPGQGLGGAAASMPPSLEPVLTYRIGLPPDVDARAFLPRLRELEEEDPQLHIVWDEALREIHVQLMGTVQIEVLKSLIRERFDVDVQVDSGRILYQETIAAPVEGVGHFEPLRHYAEVHLLLEPAERGTGLTFDTACSEDVLDRNWQRLILTHLAEKCHRGVLTGAPLTDVKITLLAGRAHVKHTEGGDFRQATWRAVRQGLMQAESVLLEPYYAFRIEVPAEQIGRAISDVRLMSGTFSSPETHGDMAVLTGRAPVATMRDYPAEVAAYTRGRGRISCSVAGYDTCHNAQEVISALGYDPTRDLDNTPDSVFCAHGAGTVIPWDRVRDYMHLDTGFGKAEAAPPAPRMFRRRFDLDDRELEQILQREFGPIRRAQYAAPVRNAAPGADETERAELFHPRRERVIVDGYNVIFAWDELRALADSGHIDAARERLMDALSNYAAFTRREVVVVFDGYRVPGGQGEKFDRSGLHVVFTRQGETADAYMEKLADEIGKNESVRVVTSDALIQLTALRAGVLRMSAREFRQELAQVAQQLEAAIRDINGR
ncbi:MAG TPA: TetM/TetW/TetO/TetS family tetracycline resistance ribosomal protection protein [Clostridiales bacterium]|nr:TetM/TetW/TetO/TetS family tetracycline resistance ribosomal protection protein [Clostridiales bacterium]